MGTACVQFDTKRPQVEKSCSIHDLPNEHQFSMYTIYTNFPEKSPIEVEK